MTKKRVFCISIGMILLAILLISCGKPISSQPITQSDLLQDTVWQLVALNGNMPIEGRDITLQFEEVTILGNGGCNTYRGGYALSGDNLTLHGVYQTEMACMEPEGIMEQEQVYFELLGRVSRFNLDDDTLILLNDAGERLLQYKAASAVDDTLASPEQVSPDAVVETTNVVEDSEGTVDGEDSNATTPGDPVTPPLPINTPSGYQPVIESASGVMVWIPESWIYTLPERGNTIILQSYALDKYVGGESRDPGDTKCDFTVHPQGITVEGVIPQDQVNPAVTVVSEEEITLLSGQTAQRFEVDSMGRSYVAVTAIGERAVTLACFGNPEPFDAIAATLSAMPDVGLSAALAMDASPAGDAVEVSYTLTNSSQDDLYVLTWTTPLEGLSGDIFTVQRDGVPVAYQGKLVKRGNPQADEYIWLGAGESYSVTVDLSEGYDVSQTGQYTVWVRSPRLTHIASSLEGQTDALEDLGMVWIPCEPVMVTISEP